jgi:biotin transport system substrate-specific component
MKVKEITLVALLTSLTAMGAFISIPMVPVPITMQSIFVLLSGILLGPILGALSQILYLLIGLMGVPIFSGFSGGINHMFKPSFGFILGFILASFVSGKVFQYLEENPLKISLFPPL